MIGLYHGAIFKNDSKWKERGGEYTWHWGLCASSIPRLLQDGHPKSAQQSLGLPWHTVGLDVNTIPWSSMGTGCVSWGHVGDRLGIGWGQAGVRLGIGWG